MKIIYFCNQGKEKGTDPPETDQDLNSTIGIRGMFWLVFVLALQVLFTYQLSSLNALE